MVLTPDQKKRIAAIESRPEEQAVEPKAKAQPYSGRFKSFMFSIRSSGFQYLLGRALILAVVVAVAGYFISYYQLHKIDFGAALAPRSGSPVNGLIDAVKEQKRKTDMIQDGQSKLIAGDHAGALAVAMAVAQADPKDQRAQRLIDRATDAAVHKATTEYDEGEIEAALSDVRLALKYRPEHAAGGMLSTKIADTLLREANVHYNKKEYDQLITKGQEVLRINPSDMAAMDLLMRANNDLQSQAGQLYLARQYLEALERVRLSLMIDPTDSSTLVLLDTIRNFVDVPTLKLRGIIRSGAKSYAQIEFPETGRIKLIKKGDKIKNLRVVQVDPNAKTVTLVQIYTKQQVVLEQPKPE